MACFSGPSIINDGLVFGYDLDSRFFQGEPTTNLFSTSTKTFTESLSFPVTPPVTTINGGYWDTEKNPDDRYQIYKNYISYKNRFNLT